MNVFINSILETANIMFLSFIRFELLSFEHSNPFVRVQSSFLSPRGIGFPSHLFSAHFVRIWKASLVFMGKA